MYGYSQPDVRRMFQLKQPPIDLSKGRNSIPIGQTNQTVMGSGGSMRPVIDEAKADAQPAGGLQAALASAGSGIGAAIAKASRQDEPVPIPAMQNFGVIDDPLQRYQPFQPEFRAYGGPVDQNQPYVVGENGPELFVPGQSGAIVPNQNTQNLQNLSTPTTGNDTPIDQGRLKKMVKGINQIPADTNVGGSDAFNATYGQTTADQIRNTMNAPASQFRKSGLWNRIGQGLVQGLGAWVRAGAPGGLAGAAGALAAGGIGYGASPSFQAEGSRQAQIAKLWGRFQQEGALQQAQAQQANMALEIQGKMLANQGKGIENTTAQFKPLWDSITADKRLTPDEQAQWEKATGRPVTPYDAQKYGLVWDNGEAFSIPELGAPRAIRNTTLPVKQVDRPFQVTTPQTGTVVPATGPQLLNAESQAAEAQAGRVQRTNEFNANNQLEADKANASNDSAWAGRTMSILSSMGQEMGNVISSNGAAKGAYDKMNEANARIQQYGEQYQQATTQQDQDFYQKQLDKATEDFSKAQQDFQGSIGKAQGGQTVLQMLQQQQQQLQRPARVTFKPIAPANPKNLSPKNERIGTQSAFDSALNRLKNRR